MKTWMIEALVIGSILIGVVLVSGGGWVEWIGALAVFISSRHLSISDRLREAEEARTETVVECHRWLDRYWVTKEMLWIAYFIALGAWSALVGAIVFILYPFWRRLYRHWRPLR